MKKITKKAGVLFTVLAALLLAGCTAGSPKEVTAGSEETSQPVPVQETSEGFSELVKEEVREEASGGEEEETAPLTVEVTWECSGGENMLQDYIFMDELKTNGSWDKFQEAYDANDNLVYTHSFELKEEEGMTRAYANYIFYTLDMDFSIYAEPILGENTSDLQTIEVTIRQTKPVVQTLNYTFEDVGARGGTGVWYADICTNEGGEVE